MSIFMSVKATITPFPSEPRSTVLVALAPLPKSLKPPNMLSVPHVLTLFSKPPWITQPAVLSVVKSLV